MFIVHGRCGDERRGRVQQTTGTNPEDPAAANGSSMTDHQDEDRDADLAVAAGDDGAT